MKIKNIELKNNLILAPMAGYSEVGMRSLCVEFGADYGVTEMVSAKALLFGSEKTKNMLRTAENETIKVVQLFGSVPEDFAKAIKLPELEKFDIIDINMGCPVNKIVKNNEGSSLMKNAALAEEIIKACVAATEKPITVKFRKGIKTETAVEFAKMCEQAGASAITVHGRTAEQGYSGKADYETIKRVKEAVKIPVIANGDVVDEESYSHILKTTKADAVMIGRGAVGKPQIFAQILNKNIDYSQKEILKKHIKILKLHENFSFNEFKKHLVAYFKCKKGAKALREKLFSTNFEKGLEIFIDDVLNYE